METTCPYSIKFIPYVFQKDLVVWKHGSPVDISQYSGEFQKDLVVWKPYLSLRFVEITYLRFRRT